MADYITTFERLYFLKNKERKEKKNCGDLVCESSGICKSLHKIYSLFHIYIMLNIYI